MGLKILFIALGGALGAISRYVVHQWVYTRYPSSFPWGTLVVNVVGCFLIGLFYSKLVQEYGSKWMTQEWSAFLIIGVCGSFTTFSTFSYESIELFKTHHLLLGFSYIGLSVILCLITTALGLSLGNL